MEVLILQIITMVSTLVLMMISCYIPYLLVISCKRKKDRRLSFQGSNYELSLSLANCFSGGVFVATFFVGLLPHIREEFEDFLNYSNVKTSFPLTEFVVLLGFFLALFVEHLTLTCQEAKKKRNRAKSSIVGLKDVSANHPHDGATNGATNEELISESKFQADREEEPNVVNLDSETENSHGDPHNHVCNAGHHDHHHHHGHSHDISNIIGPDGASKDSGFRLYALILSLSVHSIFEGMALGLQNREPDLINLFVGVIIHECLVAFAMGVSMSKIKPSTGVMFKFAFLFSVMIPVGQALGILVGHHDSFYGRASGAVLQAIAAGTFIHVTFLEVIPAELHDKRCAIVKILFIFLGFLLIIGCVYALGHHHPGGVGHDHADVKSNDSMIHHHHHR